MIQVAVSKVKIRRMNSEWRTMCIHECDVSDSGSSEDEMDVQQLQNDRVQGNQPQDKSHGCGFR